MSDGAIPDPKAIREAEEAGLVFSGDKKNRLEWCHNKTIAEAVIPDGVTVIEGEAFYECSKLTGVKIPGSVTEIEA